MSSNGYQVLTRDAFGAQSAKMKTEPSCPTAILISPIDNVAVAVQGFRGGRVGGASGSRRVCVPAAYPSGTRLPRLIQPGSCVIKCAYGRACTAHD
jgi:hypothetical protein